MVDNFKFYGRTENQVNYLLNIGNRISELKSNLIKETKALFPNNAEMLTQETEGELLKMLVKLTNSKRGIEIGTFAGYSSICLAEGLPENGELICFDISKEFTDLAKKYWALSNVENKIKLHLGNAVDKIQEVLLSDKQNYETFDFAYVDADKPNYMNYYEALLKLLKPNGWIIFDNVLWKFQVAEIENENEDENTKCFRNLNNFLQNDQRVDINMLDIADGITIVRKK